MGDFLNNIIPLIILFMLFRGISQVIFGKGKGRESEPDELDYKQEPEEEAAYENKGKPDLAADFERRLRQRTAANQQVRNTENRERGVNPVRSDRQRIHYDAEADHDTKGRVHYEGERLQHDKGRVYYDPRGNYSYNEEKLTAEREVFIAKLEQQEQQRPRLKMKRSALVQGFIMAQVLGKPRSLKPYGSDGEV